MDYPNDFDIKSFPAGKTIALSRSVSIWISIVFFLIIAMCGFLLLGIHFKGNYPFLIAIDPFTEEWSVITYPGKNENETVHQYQIVQEKLVSDFVTNWFTISDNSQINNSRWNECTIDECTGAEQFNPENTNCAISCKSNEKVFGEFSENVLPEYQKLANIGAQWSIGRMLITPPTTPNASGGMWQVYTTIYSTKTQPFDVLAFITIEQDTNKYPSTLGYYISTFNSYRINNE